LNVNQLAVAVGALGEIADVGTADGLARTLRDRAAAALVQIEREGENGDQAPTTVIVVTEAGGKERPIQGDKISPGFLGLAVFQGERQVAWYPTGSYVSVREDNAIAPGDAIKKLQARLGDVLQDLGASLRALREIRDGGVGADRDIAHAALDAIGYDDTEDEDDRGQGDDEKGCRCYRGLNTHVHDSDEDGDCLTCGCGRHVAPDEPFAESRRDALDAQTLHDSPGGDM
jgi:hypothetical protein